MKYLTQTNELLMEPSFLTFARQANEGFFFLDESDALHNDTNERDFSMTFSRWFELCKQQNYIRSYSGTNISFREYAGLVAQGNIRKDWEQFQSNLKSSDNKKGVSAEELLEEVGRVREIIKMTHYLEPIQERMLDSLMAIDYYYRNQLLENKNNRHDSGHQSIAKVRWNGDASVLCALFVELRNTRNDADERFLSIGEKELADFIFNSFEFKPTKENEAIKKSTIVRNMSKPIAKCIKLDFSDL